MLLEILQAVVKVHQRGQQVHVGHVEQGVQHNDPLVVQMKELVGILFLNLHRFHESESMDTNQNVAKTIHFEQVPKLHVKPQSTNREIRIVLELAELVRVTNVNQTADGTLKEHVLVLRGLVT